MAHNLFTMRYLAFILIFSLFFSTPAFAADPFLSDSEGGGSYAGEIISKKASINTNEYYSGARAELPNAGVGEVKKESFRGTIDSLLNKSDAKANRRRRTWTGFERIEGTEAEEKFYESSEYKVIKEFSKPISKRRSFGNKLDSIESTLRATRPASNNQHVPRYADKTDNFFGNY